MSVWTNGNAYRQRADRACECGEILTSGRKCSTCKRQTRSARRRREKLVRAGRITATERYTLREIAARDGRRCGICGKRVAMSKTVPHSRAPTIDHIVPVSAGGQDTRDNVRLAHFHCNSLRGAGGDAQLLVFG